ncbi:phage terminase small subunit [Streptomyces flavidovirens]
MGARGPRPDPRKRFSRYHTEQRASGLTYLPAEGNTEDAPDMPSGREWTPAEREMWAEVWSSPASTQFDESMAPVVALFVQATCQMYSTRVTAGLAAEVRQLADHLGLSPEGMRRLAWVIDDPAHTSVTPLREVS